MISRNQARNFFLGGTSVSFLIFLGLSWHSLSNEVPQRTHAEGLTPEVVRGKKLWELHNCVGCHTLLGEGAYYAPELTKVIERRGEEYVKVVLMSETPWAPRDRRMVAYAFSEAETADLVAFLQWIGKVELNGFPAPPKYKSVRNQ
jgi:nitric oxide reductase subunit C